MDDSETLSQKIISEDISCHSGYNDDINVGNGEYLGGLAKTATFIVGGSDSGLLGINLRSR